MKAKLGDMEGAIEYAQRSYELFPENRENAEMLSGFYAAVGQEKKAQELQAEVQRLREREVEAGLR